MTREVAGTATLPPSARVLDAVALSWGPAMRRFAPGSSLLASTVGGIGLSRGSGWPFWVGAGLVLFAVALQFLDGVISRRRADLDEAHAAELFVEAVSQQDVMSDLLAEVARSAAAMPGLPAQDRDAELLRLAQQIVDAPRAAYSNVSGLRCVIYCLDEAKTSLQVLVSAALGHRDAPRALLAGTDRGDRAVELVRSGKHLFVERISDAPEQWQGSGAGYDTFLSIPIKSSSSAYGLLTVDAPCSGDITPAIVATWRLAAALMATIFAIRDVGTRKSSGTSIEAEKLKKP